MFEPRPGLREYERLAPIRPALSLTTHIPGTWHMGKRTCACKSLPGSLKIPKTMSADTKSSQC